MKGMDSLSPRERIARARRVVVKIGSSLIAPAKEGIDLKRLEDLASQVARLRRRGIIVFLVTSGAIAAGMEKMRLPLGRRALSIPLKQAAASVGQSRLMWAYEKVFEREGIGVAQLLLTQEDLVLRKRYLNCRNTINTLIGLEILPIANENDTVAVDEIRFGDNDTLAALLAQLVEADLVILLSDVDGLYTADPRRKVSAERIAEVPRITPAIERAAQGAGPGGVGGMSSKVAAARRVAGLGIPLLILNGRTENAIERALDGEPLGTLFHPKPQRLPARKLWLSHALRAKGEIVLDDGAVEALRMKKRSLLPSGVRTVKGDFDAGDPVDCLSLAGKRLARGLTNYSASDLKRIAGFRTSEIERILGFRGADEVIHRDNLVLIQEDER